MHIDIENAMQDVEDAKNEVIDAQSRLRDVIQESNERVSRVYKTLKRVPDDIILAVMTDDLNLSDGATCLVGSVVREKLFQMANLEFVPGKLPFGEFVEDEGEKAAELFGGNEEDWNEIFYGVVNDNADDEASSQEIEIALVRRVDLAVTRA